MKTTKKTTNDKAFKSLIRRLDKAHPVMYALLRERVLCIMDLTIQDIEDNPEKWHNGFMNPDLYKVLDKIVKENLDFNP